MKKTKFILLGFIAVLFVLAMGFLTAESSTELSRGISKYIQKFFEVASVEGTTVSNINSQLRRFAHFIEYLILFTIIYSILKRIRTSEVFDVIVSFGIVFLVATFDEYFVQAYLAAGRSVELKDLMVDMLGAIVGYINLVIHRIIIKK